jgi:hypothetical protein
MRALQEKGAWGRRRGPRPDFPAAGPTVPIRASLRSGLRPSPSSKSRNQERRGSGGPQPQPGNPRRGLEGMTLVLDSKKQDLDTLRNRDGWLQTHCS